MTPGFDQHGQIWTIQQNLYITYAEAMSHNTKYRYYYVVADWDNDKHFKGTVCYKDSKDVMIR
jgi:hypothetical protein